MIKQIVIILFFVELYGGMAFAQPSSVKKRPNILFILVDDLGWNAPSSYGDRLLKTPNIDRLAKQGIKFTQYSSNSMCHPARSRLVSGEYETRTRMTEQGEGGILPNAPMITPKHIPNRLPPENYTIANMLRDAGYATMVSGKWNIAGGYRAAGVKEKHGLQFFKRYGFNYVGDAKEKPWNKIDKDKADSSIVNDFFEFLSRTHKRPFFAYLAFFAPHTPIEAPDSLVQKFVDRGFPKSTARFGDAKEKPTADYLAMIKYLDYWIGKLLDGLKQRQLAKNTIVVFTSDNGGMNRDWDNWPLRGFKGQFYEGGIRVPLLVRWPGHVPAGSVTDTPSNIIDWYPTFRSIAGGTVPSSKILDGMNLMPVLTKQGTLRRKALYWHHPQYHLDYAETPNSIIRVGDYKLIHYYGDYLDTRGYFPKRLKVYGKLVVGERNELYNLKKDPEETNNLSQKRPEKTRELLYKLNRWLWKTNAYVPTKNPDMDLSDWTKKAHIHKSRKPKQVEKPKK